MSLPRPIVAYLKQVSEQKNPFGPRCKLHHVFFTHLAEVRLSGATYKVAIQVLCASFHLGPYLHVSQCLGRKAVVEELRQAVAKGFLNEEFSITTGAEIKPVAGGNPPSKLLLVQKNAFLSPYRSLQQHELLSLSHLLADDETVA